MCTYIYLGIYVYLFIYMCKWQTLIKTAQLLGHFAFYYGTHKFIIADLLIVFIILQSERV